MENGKVKRFKEIVSEMSQVYQKKNHDYGDSFGESIKEFGVIAGVVRISDKFNRLKNLIKNQSLVTDESLSDTLLDMANYCIMLKMELEKEDPKDKSSLQIEDDIPDFLYGG